MLASTVKIFTARVRCYPILFRRMRSGILTTFTWVFLSVVERNELMLTYKELFRRKLYE
jgi:hypothetical protein